MVAETTQEQRKPAITQANIDALFGLSGTFKDNETTKKFLQERTAVRKDMQRDAERIRKEMEKDQAFMDQLREIQHQAGSKGFGVASRTAIGKLIAKIPGLDRFRSKLDEAQWEHILTVQVNRYKGLRDDLAKKLGKEPSDGSMTIQEYIVLIRQEHDSAMKELSAASKRHGELEVSVLKAKESVRDTALKYSISEEFTKKYADMDIALLDILTFEREAVMAVPDSKTKQGIEFREKFTLAIRALRDLQGDLVKESQNINRLDSLGEFYRYEEASWSMLKEGAERTYEIIEATIDDRERLVRASVEAGAMEAIVASAIKTGEQLREHTSQYLLLNAQLTSATVQASRVQTTDVIDREKLKQAETVISNLRKSGEVRNVSDYKKAKVVLAKSDGKQ